MLRSRSVTGSRVLGELAEDEVPALRDSALGGIYYLLTTRLTGLGSYMIS